MLVLLALAESSLTDLVEVRPKIDHNNFLFIDSIFKVNRLNIILMMMVIFHPKSNYLVV